MDVNLPGIDGIEATRQLRADGTGTGRRAAVDLRPRTTFDLAGSRRIGLRAQGRFRPGPADRGVGVSAPRRLTGRTRRGSRMTMRSPLSSMLPRSASTRSTIDCRCRRIEVGDGELDLEGVGVRRDPQGHGADPAVHDRAGAAEVGGRLDPVRPASRRDAGSMVRVVVPVLRPTYDVRADAESAAGEQRGVQALGQLAEGLERRRRIRDEAGGLLGPSDRCPAARRDWHAARGAGTAPVRRSRARGGVARSRSPG